MIHFVHVSKIALVAGVSVERRAGMIHFPKTRQLRDCGVKSTTAKRKTRQLRDCGVKSATAKRKTEPK